MKYEIKRGNTVIAAVHAEGQVAERIMGEQLVDATFSLPTKVQFQLWDSIVVDGRTYYLHATPTEEKLSKRNFRYTLQFAGVKYFLANILCLFPDKDNALTLSEFSITGTATKMLDLIVQNANREESGWSLGTVATSETKQVDFSGHSCLSALAKVAEAFDLEYWVDANKTISLEERKQASGYTFQYGIHKGLKGITRLPVEGANIVTRIYAEGGEKNLPGDYRNYKKRLQMPVAYLEKNTDKYGVIEAVQRFDDIYPHRTGTVTAVNADNPLQFTDANMPFDLNAVDDKGNTTILINKVSAKVTFNTGQLAGYIFEIKEHGYKHETKTFELLVNKDEKDLEVPSEALRPAVGDAYVITDIVMPQSYITTAEAELQAKAQEYLDKNSEQRNVYEVVADPSYFAEQNVNIVVGHTCLFNDVDFGLNAHLRVLGTVKNLQNLKEVQFELGETATVIHIVRAYFKAEKNTTSLRQYLKYNAEMAKRSYSFAREIADNVFDNEGYFDVKKIKPLSIDTKLLTVGSRSQQFNLVDVLLTVEQNNTAVRNTAGQIIHLTIEDNPRIWNIPANIQTGIGIGFHYIYVKAQRVGTNANILVSNERIMLEQDTVYYHFEVGYLGSVQNGFRRIKTNYGFTQVSPGEIVTGRMSSANGQHYIDLLQDRINIKGNVTFTADSPALAQTKAISETAKQQAIYTSSLDATNKVNTAKTQAEKKAKELVDNIKIGGVNLFDNRGREFSSTSEYVGIGILNMVKANIGKEMTISADVKVPISGETHFYSLGGHNVGFHKEFQLPANEWTRISATGVFGKSVRDAAEYCNLSFYGIYGTGRKPRVRNIKIEEGNKATAFSPSFADVENERDEKIAQAKSESKTAWESYANLKSSNAQQSAIETAKAYALAKDNEKETLIKAYADGKITTAERNAINVATAKANLAETRAKAHADGKVTAEEAKRIAADEQKLAQAEAKAKELVDAVEIGGRNLVLSGNVTASGVGRVRDYELSEHLKVGETYTVVVKAKQGQGAAARIWYDNAHKPACAIVGDGVFSNTFTAKTGDSLNLISFYSEQSTKPSTIFWVQIFKGNKAPKSFVPAPEDVEKDIEEARKIKAPYINVSNGNWMLYNVETGTYVDSGKTSKGDDGHPPKIVSGYWHEWDAVAKVYKNTGIKAKGDKGDKGNTGDRGLQGLQGAKGDRGIAGDKGADGRTSYTHIAYADNASGGGFSQSPTNKAYIGMYVDFKQSDSSNSALYKWSLIKGADGRNGVAGAKGSDGRTPYLHIAYANNTSGSGFSTTDSNRLYIGTYTDYTQADSTDYRRYKWSLIKGAKGDKGDKGNTGDRGDKGDRGEMIEGGKMLYTDPTFKKGVNGTHTYNNRGGSAVVVGRVAKPSDAPTTSSHILQYKYNGGATSPGFGGFTFATRSRANAVFLAKIIAKIPVGREIMYAGTTSGDGSKYTWLSSQRGTGKYETYIHRVECGATGSFSLTNYFYFNGGANTAFTVDIAFATVYDLTEYEDLRSEFSSSLEILNNKISSKVSQIDYNSLNQIVSGHTSKIEQNASSITSSVSNLNGRISSLTQTVNGMSSTVLKSGKIISQILQDGENVVIRANHLKLEGTVTANNNFIIRADGGIEAKKGKIGGFEINSSHIGVAGGIVGGYGMGLYRDFIKFKNTNTFAVLGAGLPPSSGAVSGGMITANRSEGDYNSTDNIALVLEAKGNTMRYVEMGRNYAIYCKEGVYGGFRASYDVITLYNNTDYDVSRKLPNFLMVRNRANSWVRLRLTGAKTGHIIFLANDNSHGFKFAATSYENWDLTENHRRILYYDGSRWISFGHFFS